MTPENLKILQAAAEEREKNPPVYASHSELMSGTPIKLDLVALADVYLKGAPQYAQDIIDGKHNTTPLVQAMVLHRNGILLHYEEGLVPKSGHKVAQTSDEAWKLQETYKGKPHGWIQWKGTGVCMDLTCSCGELFHIDAECAYNVKCPECGKIWMINGHVELIELVADKSPGAMVKPDLFDEACDNYDRENQVKAARYDNLEDLIHTLHDKLPEVMQGPGMRSLIENHFAEALRVPHMDGIDHILDKT